MIVVTAVQFDSTMKTALQQFVEMYFDGNQHMIASTMVSFPACSTTFNRPILDRPMPFPVINFQQMPSPPQDFRANMLMRKLDYQLLAITNDPSGQLQDQISQCLGIIFSQCRDVLAVSGIQVQRVGEPIAIPDAEHQYGVTQRVIRFLVVLTTGADNWNSNGQ